MQGKQVVAPFMGRQRDAGPRLAGSLWRNWEGYFRQPSPARRGNWLTGTGQRESFWGRNLEFGSSVTLAGQEPLNRWGAGAVSYTHLRAHETDS